MNIIEIDCNSDPDNIEEKPKDLDNDTICDTNSERLIWEKGLIAWNELFKFHNTGTDNWQNSISLMNLSGMAPIAPELILIYRC